MNYHFITIEGNIGAGKTTLAHLLSKHYNARLILEEFADNPFLPKFYENQQQYAFPLELFFMAERFKQQKEFLHILNDYSEIRNLLPHQPDDYINLITSFTESFPSRNNLRYSSITKTTI